MSELKTLTIEDNEQFLRQVSKPVVFPDEELSNNIAILEEYLTNTDVILALAAIQLGIPKRIIYLKNTNLDLIDRKNRNETTEEDKKYNEARVLINPVIISREGLSEYWEACASCLDNTGLVKRPYRIVLEYQDTNGNKHTDTFEKFEATVLSHEMDHLDGILHIDKSEELLQMTTEERKIFRQTHGYNLISETGNYEELLKKSNTKKLKK